MQDDALVADEPTAPAVPSLELRVAQRAFAALLELRRHAGQFRVAQRRAAAARTMSVLSADDRARLADWLSLQVATSAACEVDEMLATLGRVDAWLGARMRRELPHVVAALAPREGGERIVAA